MISKRIRILLCMVAIIFIVYNVVVFSIAGFLNHTATFWVSYAFMMVTFAAVISAIALLENKTLRMRDWLFRLPLIKHSVIFAICEVITSTIMMIFSTIIPVGVALAIQIVMLGIYAVFALSCLIAKEMITEVNDNVKRYTSFIKLLRIDAEMVARTSTDNATRDAFLALAEQIKYSDPISSEELADIENELKACIHTAMEAVKVNDYEQSMVCYNRAVLLLAERNEKCKIYK